MLANSELKVKASEKLQKEIEEELKIDDPEKTKAEEILKSGEEKTD